MWSGHFVADSEAYWIKTWGLPAIFATERVPFSQIRKLKRKSVGCLEITHAIGPAYLTEVRGVSAQIDQIWNFLKSRRPDIIADETEAQKPVDEASRLHSRLMLTVILTIVGVAIAASAAKFLLDGLF